MASRRPSPQQLAELADTLTQLAQLLDIKHADLHDVAPLTGTEVAVIREVHRAPRSTPSQIAERTGLQRSNVSTALRTLEARGLVLKESQSGNARSVALVPTQLAGQSMAQINAYWAGELGRVHADALRQATDALPALRAIAAELANR